MPKNRDKRPRNAEPNTIAASTSRSKNDKRPSRQRRTPARFRSGDEQHDRQPATPTAPLIDPTLTDPHESDASSSDPTAATNITPAVPGPSDTTLAAQIQQLQQQINSLTAAPKAHQPQAHERSPRKRKRTGSSKTRNTPSGTRQRSPGELRPAVNTPTSSGDDVSTTSPDTSDTEAEESTTHTSRRHRRDRHTSPTRKHEDHRARNRSRGRSRRRRRRSRSSSGSYTPSHTDSDSDSAPFVRPINSFGSLIGEEVSKKLRNKILGTRSSSWGNCCPLTAKSAQKTSTPL